MAVIWHLIDSSGVGGAERHVATLAESCRARGVEAEIVLLKDHGPNPWLEQLQRAGLPYHHLDGTWRKLKDTLRLRRPRLLHTHGYKAGLFGRSAAQLLRLPVVSTFHSGQRSAWPVCAYEWCDEWSAFASENIAVSVDVGRRLPWHSSVMSSYVRLPVLSREPLPPRIAFVGRLSPEKGPNSFCALAVAGAAVHSNLSWHVYGHGPMHAALEARYGHRVCFHGAVSDMDQVWPLVGLLVMPSQFEGTPLAALEAMAHGVPVLAAPVGGLRHIVQHGINGWHFAPDDPAAGIAAIAAWLNLSPCKQSQLRQDCRAYVDRNYSEVAQFGKLITVYRRAGLDGDTIERLSAPEQQPMQATTAAAREQASRGLPA